MSRKMQMPGSFSSALTVTRSPDESVRNSASSCKYFSCPPLHRKVYEIWSCMNAMCKSKWWQSGAGKTGRRQLVQRPALVKHATLQTSLPNFMQRIGTFVDEKTLPQSP